MHITQTINLYFSAQTRRREGPRRGFPWAHVRGGTEASLIWCKAPQLPGQSILSAVHPAPSSGRGNTGLQQCTETLLLGATPAFPYKNTATFLGRPSSSQECAATSLSYCVRPSWVLSIGALRPLGAVCTQGTALPPASTCSQGGRGNVSHAKSASSDSGLCFGEKNTFKKDCEFIPRQQCK